jgi:hypothetical protein
MRPVRDPVMDSPLATQANCTSTNSTLLFSHHPRIWGNDPRYDMTPANHEALASPSLMPAHMIFHARVCTPCGWREEMIGNPQCGDENEGQVIGHTYMRYLLLGYTVHQSPQYTHL